MMRYYTPSIKLYVEIGKLIGDDMAFDAPNDMYESLMTIQEMKSNYDDADERKKGQNLSQDYYEFLVKNIRKNSELIATEAFIEFYKNIGIVH